jgi:hypothetical protein
MTIAPLLRWTKWGCERPGIALKGWVFSYLVKAAVSPPNVGRLFLSPLNQISRLLSKLTFDCFEAFSWELKRGIPTVVFTSRLGLAYPSILRQCLSGFAVRHNSAA